MSNNCQDFIIILQQIAWFLRCLPHRQLVTECERRLKDSHCFSFQPEIGYTDHNKHTHLCTMRMKFRPWVLALSKKTKYVRARKKKKRLNILGIYSIPRHIYVESGSLLSTNTVIVWFFKIGPEFLMLIAVPGEVEHTVETKVWSVQMKFQKTTSVPTSECQERRTLDHLQNSIVPPDHDVYPSQLSAPWKEKFL